MEGECTRPALWSKPRGKYGRLDYSRFDHVTSTHMRAGRGSIGKVEVDCRFMFTKSRWGVIGERRDPAGILYLDLDFSQPPDCRLESATITVTLAKDDGEGGAIPEPSDWPVQFTDHYGPKSVRGPESLVQTRKVKNRTPEVQMFGYGAGGLGQNKEKVVQTKGRWDFSGYISSTKDSLWYNRLRWELKENSLEWQPTHNNLFHTAFAIQHNATRFYMTVQVSGKLAKLSDRIKGRLKFGGKGGKDEEIVTKIEWAEGYSCPLRLDETAQYLHEAMGMANMAKVPVEIPGALAASYHPAIVGSQTSAATVPAAMAITTQQPLHALPGTQQTPPPQHGQLQPPIGDPMQHLPALTLTELRMAAASLAHGSAHGNLHGPHGAPQRPPQVPPQGPPRLPPLRTAPATPGSAADGAEEGTEGSLSSATLVNSTTGTTQAAEGNKCLNNETEADGWQDDSGGEKEKKEEEEGSGDGESETSQVARGIGVGGLRGVAAVLLRWLGAVGMFLLWLLAVDSEPVMVGPKEKQRDVRGRPKSQASDDASESSPANIKLNYARRGRLRGRRGRQASVRDFEGGRKRRKSAVS